MSEEGASATAFGPTSFVVWGPERADLDRLAIALARAAGKEIFWIEVLMDASFSPEEVAVLQELDPSRSFHVTPQDVALYQTLWNMALWAVLREPATSSEGTRLSDYLRIPGPLRSVIERTGSVAGGVTIVVANVDRASGFYAGVPGEFTPFLEELKRLGVSVVLTNAGIPRGNVADFDVVIRVTKDATSGSVTTFCSRSDSRLAHRFVVGATVPIEDAISSLSAPDGEERASPTSNPPKTFISDLRPGRIATIVATVVKLEPVREVEQRTGGKKKVRNGVVKDGTGEISLVLWGEEVDLIAEGDKVRLVDGWVKEYKGRPQISLGRNGRVERP